MTKQDYSLLNKHRGTVPTFSTYALHAEEFGVFFVQPTHNKRHYSSLLHQDFLPSKYVT